MRICRMRRDYKLEKKNLLECSHLRGKWRKINKGEKERVEEI